MRLEGETFLGLEPEVVFDRLLDPTVIQRVVPGCEHLEEVGPGRYEARLRAGPGRVKATVSVVDLDRPRRCRLRLEGRSLAGGLSGTADVELEPSPAGTRLRYAGEVLLTGLLAAASGRMESAARAGSGAFLARLADALHAAR